MQRIKNDCAHFARRDTCLEGPVLPPRKNFDTGCQSTPSMHTVKQGTSLGTSRQTGMGPKASNFSRSNISGTRV